MSQGTFVQECPTCGRRLHIRVEYLGRKVSCQHCRGQLMACDPAGAALSPGHSAEACSAAPTNSSARLACEARSRCSARGSKTRQVVEEPRIRLGRAAGVADHHARHGQPASARLIAMRWSS